MKTQMGTHNRSVMVYGKPCAIPPSNSNNNLAPVIPIIKKNDVIG
jgi:hypothetical protein